MYDKAKIKSLSEWCKEVAEITPSEIKARKLFAASQVLRNVAAERPIRSEELPGVRKLAEYFGGETHFASLSEAEHLIEIYGVLKEVGEGCRRQ